MAMCHVSYAMDSMWPDVAEPSCNAWRLWSTQVLGTQVAHCPRAQPPSRLPGGF